MQAVTRWQVNGPISEGVWVPCDQSALMPTKVLAGFILNPHSTALEGGNREKEVWCGRVVVVLMQRTMHIT